MRSIFVSSLRSADSRLASALALTIALSPMVLASPAALAASGTVIESFGSTSLVQVGNNFYFYPVGGSSGPLFKYRGSPVAVGQYAWSYIGAEQTASGYQVALRVQARISTRSGTPTAMATSFPTGRAASSSRVRAPCSNRLSPVSTRI